MTSPASMPNDESLDYLIVGRLGKSHGVHGWIKLHSFTAPKSNILTYSKLHIKKPDGWQLLETCGKKDQTSGIIIQIKDCTTPEQASQYYTGLDIAILEENLPALDKGEFYWKDLEGLDVINTDGVSLGKVDYLIETGANDILVLLDGDKQRLIPFIMDEYVTEIDLSASRMTVDWDANF